MIPGPRVRKPLAPEPNDGLLGAIGGAALPLIGQGLGAAIGTLGGPPGIALGSSLGGALGGAGAAGIQRTSDDAPGADARLASRLGASAQGALGAGIKHHITPSAAPTPAAIPIESDPRLQMLLEDLARRRMGSIAATA